MYILDTHALLWLLFEPDKLGKNTLSILSNPLTDVRLSVVSLWEISLKYSLGKLTLQGVTPDQILKAVVESGIKFLDLSPETTAGFYNLPRQVHKDPFDRMIICQAIQNQAVLLSKDNEFMDYQPFGLKMDW